MPSAADVALFGGGATAHASAGSSADAAATDEGLRLIADHADRAGVTVALGSSLSGTVELSAVLKRADCPRFRVDLDPVALLHEAGGVVAFLDALGGLVIHVRGRDATRGAGGRSKERPVGNGDVQWAELFALLAEADFGGTVTLEEKPAALAVLREAVG